jgi:hypothetical protein
MPALGAFARAPAPAFAPAINVPRQSFEVAASTADSAADWADFSDDNMLAKKCQAVEEVFLEESRKITRRRYVAAAAVTGLAALFFFVFFFPL